MLKQKLGPDGKPMVDEKGQPIMEEVEVTPPAKEGKTPEQQLRELEEKNKVIEEKLKKSEAEKVALVAEKARRQPPMPPETTVYGQQQDGSWVFPQSKEEWQDLYDEDSVLAGDLRYEYNNQVNRRGQDLAESQKKSALKVAEKFPEMYKKDASGKVFLDANGHPVPDEDSERYKTYTKIAMESGVDGFGRPIVLYAKDGPWMVALNMAHRLGLSAEDELKRKSDEERDRQEMERQDRVKKGQVAPPGRTPPAPVKVEVKFNSKEEKQAAEAAVASGRFASLEDYCGVRDSREVPYGRGGV